MKAFIKRKKFLWLALAAACLILAACYTVFIQPLLNKEKWVYKETNVEKGSLTAGVTETGSLAYGVTSQQYEVDLSVLDSEDEDESEDDDEDTTKKYLKVEEVYAAAGERIAEGDALIKFTQDSVEDVRRLLSSAQTQAQVAYAEAESEYNLSALQARLQLESDTAAAKYANSIYKYDSQALSDTLKASQLEVERLTAGKDDLQTAYEAALESLDDAREAYEKAESALESAGDNEHVYIPAQSTYLSAKSRCEQARKQADQAKQNISDNESQIASLQQEISLASAKKTVNELSVKNTKQTDSLTGENAQVEYDAKIESLKEELSEKEEELKDISEQLESFDSFVGEDGILYANGSGIVTAVGYKAGELLASSGNVVSYASEEDMTITVDVSEEDIISMQVGDSVDIAFSAYEDVPYKGIITSIVTTRTSEDSATISYPVTIAVQGDTKALYGGMTANVTFVTQSREDVLYVSKKAIVEQNGKSYVYIENAFGKKVLREVETGLNNGASIEILSGLSEGDKVYIASKVSSEAELNDTTQEESSASTGGQSTGSESFQMEVPEGGMMPAKDMQMMPAGGMGGRPE